MHTQHASVHLVGSHRCRYVHIRHESPHLPVRTWPQLRSHQMGTRCESQQPRQGHAPYHLGCLSREGLDMHTMHKAMEGQDSHRMCTRHKSRRRGTRVHPVHPRCESKAARTRTTWAKLQMLRDKTRTRTCMDAHPGLPRLEPRAQASLPTTPAGHSA